ncbi:hypothetical protein R1sor_004720 [Riccia sorocarpa]|uniref:Mediator of RNA polymerase II transcription subunit 7 n=1 Tax=Riccia sorocarpa TaxID=122646 RepID=A0ABD3HNZ1_9MARC
MFSLDDLENLSKSHLLATADYKKELRSLNRELSFQFLKFSDVLVERPSQYARRVEDMGLILRNMHHLLNSLRPHQARSTIIHLLELQIERRKKAVEDIRRKREEVRQLLQKSLSAVHGHMSDGQDGRMMDGGMAVALADHVSRPNNEIENYGFSAAQTYR